MRRPVETEIDDSGTDSFLDVVANMVGILLILIMVVGFRARGAWQTAASDPHLLTTMTPAGAAASLDHQQKEHARRLGDARSELTSLQRNAFELDRHANELATTAEAKKQERDALQLMVTAAERAFAELRQSLDAKQQAGFDNARAIQALAAELKQVESEAHAAQTAVGEPEIVEHRPTPLAKTVFGREEHFRLLSGCVAHVPLNEMIEELKRDAENKIWKLKHVDEITETLPPRDGFRMKYTMQRRQKREMTNDGPVVRTIVELQRFVLLPVDDRPGDSVVQSLAASSPFLQRIGSLNPQETTITIWTYPDSFSEFRQLRDDLTKRGFLVAGRPLPEGFPIGGSPEGNRSAAE